MHRPGSHPQSPSAHAGEVVPAACGYFAPVLKMGGAGDPPAPVGDPPTGTAASNVAKRRCPLAQTFTLVPSGQSPDGTGGSPVLPTSHFSNTLLAPRRPSSR